MSKVKAVTRWFSTAVWQFSYIANVKTNVSLDSHLNYDSISRQTIFKKSRWIDVDVENTCFFFVFALLVDTD